MDLRLLKASTCTDAGAVDNSTNKFLADKIGFCWHDALPPDKVFFGTSYSKCAICGTSQLSYHHIDFSTWLGFGVLWEWVQKQEWFSHFMWSIEPLQKTYCDGCSPPIKEWHIVPEDFANDLCRYLREERDNCSSKND